MIIRLGGGSSRRKKTARSARLAATVLLAAGAVAAGVLPYPSVTTSRADEVTASGNNLRNGWDQSETTGTLTPATLKSGTFGELFSTQVNGQIYAEPIVVGNTMIVATENDWVYGLNATTGSIEWSSSLGVPWPSSAEQCTDLAPNVGVTGTPVYDPTVTTSDPDGAVYMVSQEVPAGHTVLNPVFYMNALDPKTGAELPNWPVLIQGAPTNDPTSAFNSFTELQRPGLLLNDGEVWAGFGSHCDFNPYKGYVVGLNTTTRSETMWTDEAGVADAQAGIWQSGGGLMSDGNGRIFFASGNGVSPAPGPGNKPPSELAESVVRLAVQSDGSLVAKDFFSPSNAPYLDSIDGDLGSGGPVGLPFGTTTVPDLLVQAGKVDGLFLLNRNNLGGRDQGPKNGDAAVSETGKGLPGQWGHPAAFADTPVLTTANVAKANDYVYYVGNHDKMRYYKAELAGTTGTVPVLSEVAQSSDTFNYTSGSPVVTSNGTSPATGVVWEVNSVSDQGTTGTLEAFPVVPPGSCSAAKPCTVSPLWTSAPFQGAGKFTIPTTNDGRVYIGTRGVISNGKNCPTVASGDWCGQVLAFGSPASAPLGDAVPVNFGDVAVGSASTAKSVTVTDTMKTGTVQVTGVTTVGTGYAVAGPYEYTPNGSTTATPATFPQTLNPGDTLTAAGVTLTPSAPGGATGELEFATNSTNFPMVGVSLSGTGTKNGFYASASPLNFGTVADGTATQQVVTVTNGESVQQTLTAAPLSAPFSVSGLPSGSQEIQPGQSILLTLTYQPGTAAPDNGSLTLTGNDGTNQTQTVIGLTGVGAADIEPTLTVAPTSVSFGTVRLGQRAEKVVTLTNSGNLPAIITVTTPPRIPFAVPDPISSGLPVNPGYTVQIPISFAPTSVGAVSDNYQLTWTDVQGAHQIDVPVTATGAAPTGGIVIPPPGGGWTFNGNAGMSGTTLVLTRPVKGQAGSAVYSVPVPSNGLKATFTAKIGGGTGADGMTFALLDASQEGQTALGGSGGELGFGGLQGVAVTLDTYKDGSNYPSGRFIGIATGVTVGGQLKFASTATNVPALRVGSHVVGVSVAGGKVTVTLDGKQYLSTAVTLPPTVRVAFTGSTGGLTDRHLVSNVAIRAGGTAIPPPGGGWSYNGASVSVGSDTRLTAALANQAGAVVYPVPVKAVGLKVTFDAQLNGGTGGDGLTLGLLNPAAAKAGWIGADGLLLGLGRPSGIPGIGVVLGTDGPISPAGFPADFIGTTRRVGVGGLRFQSVSHGIGSLRTGTDTVTVEVTKTGLGVTITIWLDGVQVDQMTEPTMTPTVRLAFTAGTGGVDATDIHIVRDVSIAASG